MCFLVAVALLVSGLLVFGRKSNSEPPPESQADEVHTREETREAQIAKVLEEAKDLEKQHELQQAISKYQEVIDSVRDCESESPALGKILVQAEAGKKRAASNMQFAATITVTNRPWADDIFPRWSVDHELRINGRLVDKKTNTSRTVKFEDIEVKAGDKITARSLWKNGYGVVGETYERPEGTWPVVELGTTRYSIVLKRY
jgi:hypothetical protein